MPNIISIPLLENIKPTTITAVVRLDANVNTDVAFRMLPPIYLENVTIVQPRPGKRAKPPIVNVPGAIITLAYEGFKRGLIVSDNAKSFPHTITIDISVGEKNVNLKLSPSTMQFCGAKKLEHITETAKHMSTYLRRIQGLMSYVKSHPEVAQKAFDWLLNNVKYEPSGVSMACDIPDDIDIYALALIQYNLRDFANIDQLAMYMRYIMSVDYIATGTFDIISVDEVMVKRDFVVTGKLPKNMEIARAFDSQKGFIAIYDTGCDLSVEILRRVEKSKGKNTRYFIFKVVRGNKIKFTGPGGEEAAVVFEDFKSILTNLGSITV